MSGDVNLSISPDVIKPILEARIQAALASALSVGQEGVFIEKAIMVALQMKVDSSGKPGDGYSYTTPLIQWLCQKAIKDAAERAVRDWAEKSMPKLQGELERQLKSRSRNLAVSMVAGLETALRDSWKFNLQCHFETPKG